MMSLYEELLTKLRQGLSLLPDKPEETPATTLLALWHAASGVPVSVARAESIALGELTEDGVRRLHDLVERRLTGVPLAHLTGRQRFMGLDLIAGPEALIPRKETELLARGVLDELDAKPRATGHVILDICTGSGNLALALAHHLPNSRVFGSDLSSDAVLLARRNSRHVGLENRVHFRCGDLLEPFEQTEFHGGVDLIVCNPPYISSKKVDAMPEEIIGHEPRLAFDGGPIGIRIVERLIHEAPRFLRSGGLLAFEVGLGQGPSLLRRFSGNQGYIRCRSAQDSEGHPRVLIGERR